MPKFALAQLNIAHARAPMESEIMSGFVQNLDRVNRLAEAADGFIWRLQGDGGDATGLRPFGEQLLVNMSVWRDPQALRAFVTSAEHLAIMRRRAEWFEPMSDASMVLWWIDSEHIPTVEEAGERLQWLRNDGPTARAFSFRKLFATDGGARSG